MYRVAAASDTLCETVTTFNLLLLPHGRVKNKDLVLMPGKEEKGVLDFNVQFSFTKETGKRPVKIR